MNNAIRSVSLLLIATLAPVSVLAGVVEFSDVTLTADATFSSERVPEKHDFDKKTVPADQVFLASKALVKSDGIPFPNVPNSQNSGFASASATVGGAFGVGVNGFHIVGVLPPNAYLAAGTWTQTLTNNSTDSVVGAADISVPAPTMRFFGIGDFFPAGRDPALDAKAKAEIRVTTKLTHVDGSVVDFMLFDQGMETFRDPVSGVFSAAPINGSAGLERFDEPDGSFGFRLPPVLKTISLGSIAPGESLEFGYDYFATASTGFGETGVFAAIGDPFDLSTSGSFSVQVDGSQPGPGPTPGIPAPGSLALLALGLSLLFLARASAHIGFRPPD